MPDAKGTTMKHPWPHAGSPVNERFKHKFAITASAATQWAMLVQEVLS
ncbi:hypothetical protein [Variovorax paradoxus]|jgi:hypothetical protein|nr:hypothetical protein [Variovorax paradoxus]